MATAAFNLTYDNTTDATFRTWVSALDTQILAMGWVHSGDTGQANLATMVRSSTIATNYTIYKTNDGLAAIYLRMEWSIGNLSYPGFSASAGFATDGAGNLTGTAVTGRWTTASAGTAVSDTTPRTCVISGSSARLTLTINMSATSLGNSIHFAIERNKTSAGADAATGLIMTLLGGTTTQSINGIAKTLGFLYLPTTGGVPAIEYAFPCILTNNGATNTFGATTGAGVPVPLAGAAQNPGLSHLVCLTAEMPTRDTTITVAMYDGSNHTYYAIGPNFTSVAGIGGTVLAGSRMLQRYD